MQDLLNNFYLVKALQSLALLFVVIILTKVAISFSSKGKKRMSETPYVIKYTALIVFAFSLIFIWLDGIAPVLTALTIVAAALTIVSKELLLNFLGSFVIFWRELFAIGDRVQVGDHAGDVIDKGLLFFTLLEAGQTSSTGHSTGRLIKVPNAMTLTMPVINATRGAGYVWNEVAFTVRKESDWEKARGFLTEVVEDFIRREGIDLERVKRSFENRNIFYNKLTPRVYVSVSESGIRLTLRYICNSRLIRESEDFIATGFLRRLEPGVVDLAAL